LAKQKGLKVQGQRGGGRSYLKVLVQHVSIFIEEIVMKLVAMGSFQDMFAKLQATEID
jgi:hypothetical protein